MYNIIKEVILSKHFELTSMLEKIDIIWLQGDITKEQKNELEILAREKADPTLSLDLKHQIEQLTINMQGLIKRIEQLEAKSSVSPEIPSNEFPEFELHHAYINGDKVTFEGKKYICTLPEHTLTTTWSPKDYPPYWTLQA